MSKYFHLLIALFAILFLPTIFANAQDNDGKTVSLVVSGEGATKDEATKNALRSAIEQTFGTFVSANTAVLNDELIKDEIVTVTSGNVQSYKEIGYLDKGDIKEVSLQAVVSIGKLVSYAHNKGMTTELAGATFAMNKKIYNLNKKNEKKAMDHLMIQLKELADNGLFDYQIEVGDPKVISVPKYSKVPAFLSEYNQIEIMITAVPNAQADLFQELIYNTVSSLKLPFQDLETLKKGNMDIYPVFFLTNDYLLGDIDLRYKPSIKSKYDPRPDALVVDIDTIYLRNSYVDLSKEIQTLVEASAANFVLSDNLMNRFNFNCQFSPYLCMVSDDDYYKVFGTSRAHQDLNSIHFAFASKHKLNSTFTFCNYYDENKRKVDTIPAMYYSSPVTKKLEINPIGYYIFSNQRKDIKPFAPFDLRRPDFGNGEEGYVFLPGISTSNFRFFAFYSDIEMDSLSKIFVTPSPKEVSKLFQYGEEELEKHRIDIIAVSNFKEK